MDPQEWETPVLIVLTRSLPEDGVLQLLACKFIDLGGPSTIDCIAGEPGDGGFVACEAWNSS
jgi:hypothetical protein